MIAGHVTPPELVSWTERSERARILYTICACLSLIYDEETIEAIVLKMLPFDNKEREDQRSLISFQWIDLVRVCGSTFLIDTFPHMLCTLLNKVQPHTNTLSGNFLMDTISPPLARLGQDQANTMAEALLALPKLRYGRFMVLKIKGKINAAFIAALGIHLFGLDVQLSQSHNSGSVLQYPPLKRVRVNAPKLYVVLDTNNIYPELAIDYPSDTGLTTSYSLAKDNTASSSLRPRKNVAVEEYEPARGPKRRTLGHLFRIQEDQLALESGTVSVTTYVIFYK